jgi:hypothetical protein
MPRISLTDFVDFVATAGTQKLTKVRTVKNRPKYLPAFDYWRALREGIKEFHRKGARNKGDLDRVASGVSDPTKHARYMAVLQEYKRFLGRKKIAWFDPPSLDWSYDGLIVRINPELGLRIDGVSYVVKLYFKKETLSRNRVAVVLDMMNAALAGKGEDMRVAVLDVPAGKLITASGPSPQINALLESEAASFLQLWDAV